MGTHPAFLEVVRSRLMSEDVNKELSTGLQSTSDLGHQQLVILHVFEKLNGDDAVESGCLKFVTDHITSNDFEIGQSLGVCLLVNVRFLSSRV